MSKQKANLGPVSVTIRSKDGEIEIKEFSTESAIFGSGPSANFKLEGADISSIHAMVKNKGDGKVSVLDLGSESGIKVNGDEVAGEIGVEENDEITIGAYVITISAGGHIQENATEPDRKQHTGSKSAAAESTSKKGSKKKAPEELSSTEDSFGNDRTGEATLELLATDLQPHEKPSEGKKVVETIMMWGETALEVAYLDTVSSITIGDAKGVTFLTPAEKLPAPSFPLVRGEAGGYFIELANGFEIDLKKSGAKSLSLEDLKQKGALKPSSSASGAMSYKLELDDAARVTVGSLTFMVRYVAPQKPTPSSVYDQFDYYFGKLFAASFIVHTALFFAMMITPTTNSLLDEDLFKNPNKLAKFLIKAPDDKKKKEDLSGKKDGAKHKDDEGKFGKKDKPQKDAMASKKGAPTVDVNKREQDRKIALNSGALSILRKAGTGGSVSNIFGPGGIGTGMNSALGGLSGASLGDAGGAGGLGTRGTGPGGGGSALGIGGLGSGTGRGSGQGRGDIDLGGRGKGTMKIDPGKTLVEGSLSKEEIGRVIRRYLNQIKYCYEKELQQSPNLYGKIVVNFQIGGTGNVNDASVIQTSLNNNNVEECVLRIIRRLRFPQPRGGGVVVVTYPFIFQQSGSE